MTQNLLKMDKLKFDKFKDYILRANRTNTRVNEIFYKLNKLYEKVKDELIAFKPTNNEYNYNAHLDNLEHELNKLDFDSQLDDSRIKQILNNHNTKLDDFIQWYIDIPENNLLYEILNTDLDLLSKIEAPEEDNYSAFNNYSYSDIQEIQNSVEVFIKHLYFNKLIALIKTQKTKRKKLDKDLIWFKVGLLFATGEINTLKKQFDNNASQIAKHKFKDKWSGYRPYISNSISNTTNDDKNIFSNNAKLKKIYNYCINSAITMDSNFEDIIHSINPN